MKNILIVGSGIGKEGGTGNSLFNLLSILEKYTDQANIDLLLTNKESVSIARETFKNINVQEPLAIPKQEPIAILLMRIMKKKNVFWLMYRILYKMGFKLPFLNYAARNIPKIEKSYDVAISYHMIPSVLTSYVALGVRAKKKIAWSHSDVNQKENRKIPGSSAMRVRGIMAYQNVLKAYDKIVCVSKGAAQSFKSQFQQLTNKVIALYNFSNVDYIQEQSMHGVNMNNIPCTTGGG